MNTIKNRKSKELPVLSFTEALQDEELKEVIMKTAS